MSDFPPLLPLVSPFGIKMVVTTTSPTESYN